jgi:pantoate--beta-alanine ligase
MGEKDFQQIVVLETMLKDLNFECKIRRCGIVRESDGLAMSSRNKYLNTDDRKKALCLSKSLVETQKLFSDGTDDPGKIISEISKIIQNSNGKIDYIEIVDSVTLKSVSVVQNGNRILLAVKIAETRLIDNIELVSH